MSAVKSLARSDALVTDLDRPPRAVTMRVLDLDGHEVHSAIRGDVRK
jgi:hypothetical protein